MSVRSEQFEVRTRGKGTYEITDQVQKIVKRSGIITGTVTVFVQHTSCGLVIMENAAPAAVVTWKTSSNGSFRRTRITSTTTKDQMTPPHTSGYHVATITR
jgi:putative lipoic acid-binding regulatory protein